MFSRTDNIPFYFQGAKTNSSVILKLVPSNVDFYHLGAGVGGQGCLEFCKPEKFTCENSGNGSNYSWKEKKFSYGVCVFLFPVHDVERPSQETF